MIPFLAILDQFRVQVSSPRPVLDTKNTSFTIDLLDEVTGEMLDTQLGRAWREGPVELTSLELPGATLTGGSVTIGFEGNRLVVRVHRNEA